MTKKELKRAAFQVLTLSPDPSSQRRPREPIFISNPGIYLSSCPFFSSVAIYNLGEFPWRDLDLSKGRSEVATSVFFNTVSNHRPGLCSRQLSLMMAKVYGGHVGQTRPWTVPFGEVKKKRKEKRTNFNR